MLEDLVDGLASSLSLLRVVEIQLLEERDNPQGYQREWRLCRVEVSLEAKEWFGRRTESAVA